MRICPSSLAVAGPQYADLRCTCSCLGETTLTSRQCHPEWAWAKNISVCSERILIKSTEDEILSLKCLYVLGMPWRKHPYCRYAVCVSVMPSTLYPPPHTSNSYYILKCHVGALVSMKSGLTCISTSLLCQCNVPILILG